MHTRLIAPYYTNAVLLVYDQYMGCSPLKRGLSLRCPMKRSNRRLGKEHTKNWIDPNAPVARSLVYLHSTAISDANEEDEEWDFIVDDGEDRDRAQGTSLSSRGASIGTASLSFAKAQHLAATARALQARSRGHPPLLTVRAFLSVAHPRPSYAPNRCHQSQRLCRSRRASR